MQGIVAPCKKYTTVRLRYFLKVVLFYCFPTSIVTGKYRVSDQGNRKITILCTSELVNGSSSERDGTDLVSWERRQLLNYYTQLTTDSSMCAVLVVS